MVQLSHPYLTIGKTIAFIIQTFVGKVMSLLFNTLSRLDTAFLPKGKRLWISWLHSQSTVILESKKRKSVTDSNFCPFYLLWSDGTRWHDLSCCCFLMLSFKPAFSFPSFILIKGSLVPLHFLLLKWYHLHIWGWHFSGKSWFQHITHPAQYSTWYTLHIS